MTDGKMTAETVKDHKAPRKCPTCDGAGVLGGAVYSKQADDSLLRTPGPVPFAIGFNPSPEAVPFDHDGETVMIPPGDFRVGTKDQAIDDDALTRACVKKNAFRGFRLLSGDAKADDSVRILSGDEYAAWKKRTQDALDQASRDAGVPVERPVEGAPDAKADEEWRKKRAAVDAQLKQDEKDAAERAARKEKAE